jgi:hypothetical protein
MKQVIQDFKTGELFVDDVPVPLAAPGFVLVRNHYSLISAGTEQSTVTTAKASLLGKARQQPDLAKERIEIFGGDKSFIINDFRTAEIYSNGKRKKVKAPGKGHKEEVELFVGSIREGSPSPIPLRSLLYTTSAAFRVLDSLHTGLPQDVNIP